jgi:hypothetical protein
LRWMLKGLLCIRLALLNGTSSSLSRPIFNQPQISPW